MADPFGPISDAIYRNRRSEIDDRGMTIAEAEEARRQADYDRRQAKMAEYAGALNEDARAQGDIAPAAESGALPEQPVARGAAQDTEIQMAPRRAEMQPGPDGTLIAPARDASGSERSPPEAEARAPLSGPENYPADAGDVSGQTSVAPLESGDYQNQPGPVGAAEDRRSDVSTKIESAIRNPKQRRDILRDPERLRRMATIAVKNGDDKFVEWLKAASLAEKENSFEAMGHLLNNNATAAREAFDGTGDQKTDGTDPIKNDDGKTWTLTLEGGRKVTLDPEHYLETMSNPAKYAERKLAAEKSRAEIDTIKEHGRYYGKAADRQGAETAYITDSRAALKREEIAQRATAAANALLARAGAKGPQRVFSADEQASIEKVLANRNWHEDPNTGKKVHNADQETSQRIASMLLKDSLPDMPGQMIGAIISKINVTPSTDLALAASAEYKRRKNMGATDADLGNKPEAKWAADYKFKLYEDEIKANHSWLQSKSGGVIGFGTSGPWLMKRPATSQPGAGNQPGAPMAIRTTNAPPTETDRKPAVSAAQATGAPDAPARTAPPAAAATESTDAAEKPVEKLDFIDIKQLRNRAARGDKKADEALRRRMDYVKQLREQDLVNQGRESSPGVSP